MNEFAKTKSEERDGAFWIYLFILGPTELMLLLYHQLLKYGAKQEINLEFWIQVILVNIVVIVFLTIIIVYLKRKGKIPYNGRPRDPRESYDSPKEKWTAGMVFLTIGSLVFGIGFIILNITYEGTFTHPYEVEGIVISAIGGLLILLGVILISKMNPGGVDDYHHSQTQSFSYAFRHVRS